MSRLANINMFVLELGVFCAAGGIFYPIRQGFFVSLFPLISVINVPFMWDCSINNGSRGHSEGNTESINTELCDKSCSLCT